MNGLRSLLTASLLLLGAVLPACEAAKVAGGFAGAAQTVTLQLSPDTIEVAPGGATQFHAEVTGSVVTTATWTVVEAGGGTIGGDTGLYTAPATTGTYHVKAAAVADPTVSATAVVTVTAAPAVQVVVTPHNPSILTNATVNFRADVANATNGAVTWRVQEANCGSITTAGAYTAPATAATCHVIATSVQDGTKTDTATVTVSAPAAIRVTLNTATAAVNSCGTASFTASVTGTTNSAVTWSVVESGGGSVTTAGVYTAPSTAGTYHVMATSVASAASTATATITVTDRVISVSVSPSTLSLSPGATGQFTATVTTSCGTFASVQSVTAPL